MSDSFSIDLQAEDFTLTAAGDGFTIAPLPSDHIFVSFASSAINASGLPAGGTEGQIISNVGSVTPWVDPPLPGETDNHLAAEVPFPPYETLLGTNVQVVIEELYENTAPIVHTH